MRNREMGGGGGGREGGITLFLYLIDPLFRVGYLSGLYDSRLCEHFIVPEACQCFSFSVCRFNCCRGCGFRFRHGRGGATRFSQL
ncbi:unnamed protein product [Ixodes pacificus]